MNNGVYAAEQWNPATATWKTLAAEQMTRQYHSTALLLLDRRVLSSGGGICGTCDAVGYLAKNAQVFAPPYLFAKDGSGQLAPRPVVSSAPAVATYGVPFKIASPDAAKVALVRLAAVTHSGEHGAALCAAGVHGRGHADHRHGAGGRQHRPARGVHAVPARRRRRAVGSRRW